MLSFFQKKTSKKEYGLTADIHSHLLPGLDDGVKTFDESVAIIRQFQAAGYTKLVTTPHIMSDTYRNEPRAIMAKLNELRAVLARQDIPMQIDAAAEYYLDSSLIHQVEANVPLLTFGGRYVLFEMNYMTEPYQLKDFIFKLITQGYKPVLAHPERYQFMTLDKAEDLYHRGVLLQINLLSFVDYYSKDVRVLANQIVDQGWVSFLGSDCHHVRHSDLLSAVQKNKYFKKALALPLLNNQL